MCVSSGVSTRGSSFHPLENLLRVSWKFYAIQFSTRIPAEQMHFCLCMLVCVFVFTSPISLSLFVAEAFVYQYIQEEK